LAIANYCVAISDLQGASKLLMERVMAPGCSQTRHPTTQILTNQLTVLRGAWQT